MIIQLQTSKLTTLKVVSYGSLLALRNLSKVIHYIPIRKGYSYLTKFLFELGFLIVVQDKDEKDGGTTIGEFVPGDRQKPLKCSSSVYSGITHANPEAKNEVRNNLPIQNQNLRI